MPDFSSLFRERILSPVCQHSNHSSF
jgi:intracellular sulfur oxidation DsrE/DsrF family protein